MFLSSLKTMQRLETASYHYHGYAKITLTLLLTSYQFPTKRKINRKKIKAEILQVINIDHRRAFRVTLYCILHSSTFLLNKPGQCWLSFLQGSPSFYQIFAK